MIPTAGMIQNARVYRAANPRPPAWMLRAGWTWDENGKVTAPTHRTLDRAEFFGVEQEAKPDPEDRNL